MGRTLQLLNLADIMEINRQMIDSSGGNFYIEDSNLLNPSPLLYTLEAIGGPLFGEDLYPSIFQKAAHLCCRIIQGHVFHDGNKRTGMEACRNFLEMNGYFMRVDKGVVDMALRIAKNKVTEQEVVSWLEGRTTQSVSSTV